MKKRYVLGVMKNGPDYNWFNLSIDGLKTLGVADEKVAWSVDENAAVTTAVIKRKLENKKLVISQVKITGPKDEISNLMNGLGIGTPSEPLLPHWRKKEEY